MTRFVKVCGITRQQDADLAVELGATAIGFVFWPGSPRYVKPEQARSIAAALPETVSKVGVFVDEPAALVGALADHVGLTDVQLHGAESSDYIRTMPRRVIKAIGLKNAQMPRLDAYGEDVLILLDAYDPVRHGGTGQMVDWSTARAVATLRPTILSGGLRPENVSEAIVAVKPFGVDVSSGVESAPGIKDPSRMRSFFEALHG